jgi:hypothetical protein
MATKTAWMLGAALGAVGCVTLVSVAWSSSAGESRNVAAAPNAGANRGGAPARGAAANGARPRARPAPVSALADEDPPKPAAPKAAPQADPAEAVREKLQGCRMSVDWRETPLFDALAEIAAKSGVEIVVAAEVASQYAVHPDDSKIEMLHLDQAVQANQILDLVTQLRGLNWKAEESRVVIVPADGQRDASKPVVGLPKWTPPAPISVSGHVSDAKGAPVAGAEIVNISDGKTVATTDGGGAFTLSLTVPYGGIQARARGHVRSAETPVEGKAGSQVTVDLALRGPSGALVVRVRSDAGPVAGAKVAVRNSVEAADVSPQEIVTDADGTATFTDVAPGAARIDVALAGYTVETPGAPADVVAGKSADVNVHVVKKPPLEAQLDQLRVSFNFQGATFGDVVKFLNDAKQLSIVIDPAIAQELDEVGVTLKLEDVSMTTALRTLCKVGGNLTYVVHDPVIFIRKSAK